MPNDLNPPIFLERRSYRQRRMMDAVRLLPLIGLLLWLLPTLWPDPGTQTPAPDLDRVNTSQAIIYVFGVWIGLILCGCVLWRYLVARGDGPDTGEATGTAQVDPTADLT